MTILHSQKSVSYDTGGSKSKTGLSSGNARSVYVHALPTQNLSNSFQNSRQNRQRKTSRRPVSSSVVQCRPSHVWPTTHQPRPGQAALPAHPSRLPPLSPASFSDVLTHREYTFSICQRTYESYEFIRIHTSHMGTYSSHIHHIFNAVTCCIHAALRALYAHVVPCHTSRHTSTWSSTAGHAHQREGHTLPRSLRSLKPLKYIYCIMVDDVWCPNTSYIWCVCTFDKLKHVERGFTRKNSEHANYWILLNWVGQETWNTTTISHDRR